MTQRIVFFDLETGGLDAKHPDIQLAAVATEGLQEVDAFEAKIRFDPKRADPQALAINHFDEEVWRLNARPESEVVLTFAAFLEQHATLRRTSKSKGKEYRVAWLAGHNVITFDMPRLRAMFFRHGVFLAADTFRPLDTIQLALWHGARTGEHYGSYKLGDLCDRFGIESSGAHDALADVRMCVALARVLGG